MTVGAPIHARQLGCAFCGEISPLGGLTRATCVRLIATGEMAYHCSQWLDRRTKDGTWAGCKTRVLRRRLGDRAEIVAGRQAELFGAYGLNSL